MVGNYTYYAFPVLWFLPLTSSLRGLFIRLRVDDNANPRLVLDQLEKSGKYSPRFIAKLRRRQSCEQNSWEGLPIILAALLAGNQAGLSAEYMNGVTLAYILIRIAYTYHRIESKKLSYIRSLLWWAGNFCSFVTLVKAGNAINAKLL